MITIDKGLFFLFSFDVKLHLPYTREKTVEDFNFFFRVQIEHCMYLYIYCIHNSFEKNLLITYPY